MTALIPLVVMLPLIGAAGALIAGKRQRLQVIVTVVALVAMMVVSILLLIDVDATGALVEDGLAGLGANGDYGQAMRHGF